MGVSATLCVGLDTFFAAIVIRTDCLYVAQLHCGPNWRIQWQRRKMGDLPFRLILMQDMVRVKVRVSDRVRARDMVTYRVRDRVRTEIRRTEIRRIGLEPIK